MHVEEVAALLNEHPETIRRRIRSGKVKATKLGKRYDISREEMERLKAERPTYQPTDIEVATSKVIEVNEAKLESSILMLVRNIQQLGRSIESEQFDFNRIESVDDFNEMFTRTRLFYEKHRTTFNFLKQYISEVEEVENMNKMLAIIAEERREMLEEAKKHNDVENN